MKQLFRTRLFIFTVLLLSGGLATAGNIYKWVDKDGNLHYSEQAPGGVDAKQVKTDTRKVHSVPPPQANSTPATDTQQVVQDEPAEAQMSRKEERRQREEACTHARDQISRLEPSPRVLIKQADGSTRRLQDQERLDWLQKAKDMEKEFCKK